MILQGIGIFVLVVVGIGLFAVWCWGGGLILVALMGRFDSGSFDDDRQKWLYRLKLGLVLFLGSTLLAVMGGVALSSSQDSSHGSCKIGHYEWTGKTNSFVCDEWYPLPQVQGQP